MSEVPFTPPPKQRKVALVATFLGVSFLIIALLIETLAYVAVQIRNPDQPSDWLFGAPVEVPVEQLAGRHPCLEMISHPLLPYVHNHQDRCEIQGGRADGGFVEYGSDEAPSGEPETLVTLGGSTTDGFYYEFSRGRTWPLQLQERLARESLNVRVLNGGAGGYGSSQELLRLITDVSFLDPSPTLIVSLSGINDLEGYGGTSGYLMEAFPLYRPSQIQMFCRQQWILQDAGSVERVLLPSTIRILRFLGRGFGRGDDDCALMSNIRSERVNYESGPGRWARNMDVAHGAASGLGATYVQFLQPTLGLNHVAPPIRGSSDYELFQQMDGAYVDGLNQDYALMKTECARRDFCFDISDILQGSQDWYSDSRHPNAQGNALIAGAIYGSLKGRGLLLND